MHDPKRTIDYWNADQCMVKLWSSLYELIWSGSDREFVREFLDPSAWQVTVGRLDSAPAVPNPSYVVGGLGWVSPAAGLRMEVKR
ncbi:hypothetical protein [Tsukamurella paurometabola]|uniref:Uncharacterized protein n=1 Tax=Tsukamurella paurometabola TaxID=2061 RepID=A0ABS5NDS5_TSUPA|nr:hypothetical protein [Tsukamurella paurometabola]MBS4102403.1 hypothetical protein [Tsukamurella paurometabola]